VKLILIQDEAKDDETAIGFPSSGANMKEPTSKTKLNKEL